MTGTQRIVEPSPGVVAALDMWRSVILDWTSSVDSKRSTARDEAAARAALLAAIQKYREQGYSDGYLAGRHRLGFGDTNK